MRTNFYENPYKLKVSFIVTEEKQKQPTEECQTSEVEAATKIQAAFRGHKTRKSISMKTSKPSQPSQEPEPTRAELEAEFRADDKGRVLDNLFLLLRWSGFVEYWKIFILCISFVCVVMFSIKFLAISLAIQEYNFLLKNMLFIVKNKSLTNTYF